MSFGSLYRVCCTTYLLLEHKATRKRNDLLWREIIEDAVKDHLGEHQLVGRVDLTRHTALHLDDAFTVHEAQAPQHLLHGLELFLQDHLVGISQVLLDRLYHAQPPCVCVSNQDCHATNTALLHLGVTTHLGLLLELELLLVQCTLLLDRRRPEGVLRFEPLLECLNFLLPHTCNERAVSTTCVLECQDMQTIAYANQLLERWLFDAHILDRVEKRQAGREALHHLAQRFRHTPPVHTTR